MTPVVACSSGDELLVRGRRRVDGEAAHVADVGEVAEQLEPFDELRPASSPPSMPNAMIAPGPVGQVLLRARRSTGSTPGPGYVTHSTSSRASSHSATASAFCAVALHAQAQRLEALEEEERVERRDRGPMSRWYCSRALRMYCAGRSGSGSCEKTRPW